MRIFVTGITGFIGYHVARLLVEKSFAVRALIRDKSNRSVLNLLDVEPFYGDLRDKEALIRGIKGCQQVYHVAADYRLWVTNPQTMYDVNVKGTRNVMTAARDADVEKIIYTSTVGVWAGNRSGEQMNETTDSALRDMIGHYKRSKYLAEKEVSALVEKGLPVIIVNPSTPLGTRDHKPTPTGKMIVDFLNGKIPAYLNTGLNFVDVEDVAAGHWLAAIHGKIGERYILGNRNMTLKSFFKTLAHTAGKEPLLIRLPYYPVLLAAYADEMITGRILHRDPRVPVTGVKMARKYMFFNSEKAVTHLGLPQSPVELAVQKAVEWFRQNGYLQSSG